MPSMRAFVLSAIAALSLGSPAVLAGDQTWEVGNDALIVSIDGTWNEVDVSSADPDAVGFQAGNQLMQWLFVPTTNDSGKKVSEQALRMQTQDLRRELKSQGGEVSDDLLELSGGQVQGYYVKGVDPKAGSDEWEFAYAGFVLVNGKVPVMFNITWDKGGEGAANRALAAVRGMRLGRN